MDMLSHLYLRHLCLAGKLVFGTAIVVWAGVVLCLLGLFAVALCQSMHLGSSEATRLQSRCSPLQQLLAIPAEVESSAFAPHHQVCLREACSEN